LPESFAPSAETFTFQSVMLLSVHLPESFRGGCSFGAKLIVSPDKIKLTS